MQSKIYKLFIITLIPENRVIWVSHTSFHPNIVLYDLTTNNTKFKECIKKYGEECFYTEIIEVNTDLNIIKMKEKELIQYYQTISPLFKRGLTKEEKEVKREFFNNTLKPWLENNPHPNKNRSINEEEREKHKNNGRNIQIECIETGVQYISIGEASRVTGLSYDQLRNAIYNNKIAGGYHWRIL